jgi:hypothetical protein
MSRLGGLGARTFAITGIGRSGTTFLASVLDQSPTWTVRHEAPGIHDTPQETVQTALSRFRAGGERYGEVNPGLRWVVPFLPVAYSAVILRSAREIYFSILNRKPVPEGVPIVVHQARWLGRLEEELRRIRWLAECPVVDTIDFARMTSDAAYRADIARRCGIDDLPSEAAACQAPRNASKTRIFSR